MQSKKRDKFSSVIIFRLWVKIGIVFLHWLALSVHWANYSLENESKNPMNFLEIRFSIQVLISIKRYRVSKIICAMYKIHVWATRRIYKVYQTRRIYKVYPTTREYIRYTFKILKPNWKVMFTKSYGLRLLQRILGMNQHFGQFTFALVQSASGPKSTNLTKLGKVNKSLKITWSC